MNDQNKIIGKEICVAAAFYGEVSEKKMGYGFQESLLVDPIVLDLNSVTMDMLKDCVKQLEAMGTYEELAKAQGYKNEGYKATGLVIQSKLDPRVVMSVECGRRWNKDSDAQWVSTGESDLTLKWYLNDEAKDQQGVKGVQPEHAADAAELDLITKIREATKQVPMKTESYQPVMNAIKMGYGTLAEAELSPESLLEESKKESKKEKKEDDKVVRSGTYKGKKWQIVQTNSGSMGSPVDYKLVVPGVFSSDHFKSLAKWSTDREIKQAKSFIDDAAKDSKGSKGSKKEKKKVTEAEEGQTPIQREVTIELTLKEAAEALGYGDWAKENDYLDADPHEDVHHSGYSAKDAANWNDPKGMDGATSIFPEAVVRAVEDAERDGWAAAIGEARRDAIKDALELIQVAGEYQSGDGDMIGVKSAGVKSAEIDTPANKVTVMIENPEHLINDLMAGLGQFSPEMDPYTAEDDDKIKRMFIQYAGGYFDIYGDRKPSGELGSQFSPDTNDDFMAEQCKVYIDEMSVDEIAEAIADAVDSGRVDSEAEAITMAVKLSGENKKAIAQALKKMHGDTSKKYADRAAGIPEEESVNRVGKKPAADAANKPAKAEVNMKEGIDFVSVDFWGMPNLSEEVQVGDQQKKATSPDVVSVAQKDKEVDKMAANLKTPSGKQVVMKAGAALAKPSTTVDVGVKSGEAALPDAALKTGDAEDGKGDEMIGKGNSDDQQKELPSIAIKTGKAADGRGKVMADSKTPSKATMSEARKAQVQELMAKQKKDGSMAKKMGEARKKKMQEKMKSRYGK